MSEAIRFAFAGDRDIAVWVLEHLLESGHEPLALLLRASRAATHAEELQALCPSVPPERIFRGKRFREDAGLETLEGLELDYIIGVHFPYLVPREVLEIPRHGVLNLHPAYLPFNRGWHTPSWAILEDTPIGATLHFMSDAIDGGDIVRRERLEIEPGDTADSLYGRIKKLELQVFRDAWPDLVAGTYTRSPQDPAAGTSHVRDELLRDDVQRIDPSSTGPAVDLIRRLRALTTNDVAEAAYYEQDGKRYRIRVDIVEHE